jgi:signal transduction histidine kinase
MTHTEAIGKPPTPPTDARGPSFLTAPFNRRTWNELLYALIGLPLAIFGFTWAVTAVSVGAGVAPTVFGLWFLATAILSQRWLGALDRNLLGSLLGEQIAAPRPVRTARGKFDWARTRLSDPVAWRAWAYEIIRFPLAITTFAFTVAFWAAGLGGITYRIWYRYLPALYDQYGHAHHGMILFYNRTTRHGYWVDTTPRIIGLAAAGVLLFWLTPWITRGFVNLHRALGRALLGPVSMSRRVQDLEETRTRAVTAAADRLRGIERDLHDGTQARLVALAMNLGQVKEDLEVGDPRTAERARELIDQAHRQTKEALVELRDIARGIHPAILDNGLEAALASLAANAPFPVSVGVELPQRPSPTSETIAYFTIAELLTNAVKHSGALGAQIIVTALNQTLRLVVTDDGRGGALRGGGSGLAGVADRLATVDGGLHITSPIGGPTTVSATLPLRA